MADPALDPQRWITQSAPNAQFSPEAMQEQARQQAMLASILMPEGIKERGIDRQQAYADILRKREAPQGFQGKRVFTKASPWEFLGAGIERVRGEQEQGRLEKERTGMGDRLLAALREQAGLGADGKKKQPGANERSDLRDLSFTNEDPDMQRLIEEQQSAFYGDE